MKMYVGNGKFSYPLTSGDIFIITRGLGNGYWKGNTKVEFYEKDNGWFWRGCDNNYVSDYLTFPNRDYISFASLLVLEKFSKSIEEFI